MSMNGSNTSAAARSSPETARERPGWRLAFLLPVGVFAIVAAAFAVGLTMDPREIPSVLIGPNVAASIRC
jgi:hypothetical protein